jgi:hypothetical protein
MLELVVLVSDPLGNFLPSGIMEFVVPGAVAAGLFTYVIYKLLKEWGFIGGL